MNEATFKRAFQERLLGELLDRYERSVRRRPDPRPEGHRPGARRPQLVWRKSAFWTDYTDEMDYKKRVWMNDVCRALAASGVLSLKWERFREGDMLERVQLEWGGIDAAYRLIGRDPYDAVLERLRSVLSPLQDHPWTWVRDLWGEIDGRLAEHRRPLAPFEDPEAAAPLVRVLLALPHVDEDGELKRLFSQRLFGDSKYFERHVERRLLMLLKRHAPPDVLAWDPDHEASDDGPQSREVLLDSVGVLDNPGSLWLSGPIVLKTRRQGNGQAADGPPVHRLSDSEKRPNLDERLNFEALSGGVGLSSSFLRRSEIVGLDVERVVLIENWTSFHQWVHERAGAPELVIYTGGFPRRIVQRFLAQLASYRAESASARGIPVYHWGDIDIGGIRIASFLKARFFPDLLPLLMDVETLEAYKDRAMAVDEGYARTAAALLDDPRYEAWRPVLRWIADRRLRLEQESIDSVKDTLELWGGEIASG
ncbi:MAG: DUF2399 domain-containing protein [Hydrogenibacillus schlegelii]|nr:DUF2399 domain-containing protein [Hydrogenibacillus schlegelii]